VLALENVKWMKETKEGETEGFNLKDCKFFNSNDPAPAFNTIKEEKYKDFNLLKKILNEGDVFTQNRVLFTVRNLGGDEAVEFLSSCYSSKFSALFKHEVSFILGQMAKKAKKALTKLEEVLQDEKEDPIVRHETALTLGEISVSKDLLEKYSTHENQLIAESCIIAQDFMEFWKQFNGDCC